MKHFAFLLLMVWGFGRLGEKDYPRQYAFYWTYACLFGYWLAHERNWFGPTCLLDGWKPYVRRFWLWLRRADSPVCCFRCYQAQKRREMYRFKNLTQEKWVCLKCLNDFGIR